MVAGVVIPSAEARAASPSQVERAAYYFGDANPINFWNSDLSGASAAFQQMKSNGFNAVEFVVPWGEFQEGISPQTYNQTSFKRLASLVSVANSQHLQVILRLSYGLDIDPKDQDTDRFETVFSNQAVYNAWLAYISKVHQSVARFPNVKVAQLSWEDFYEPVQAAQVASTISTRLQLAVSTGFRSWAQGTYPLSKISSMYGTTFNSWSQVPTPSNSSPSFKLMYQFDDWDVVHRFFLPAAARFPGLNLEARVDVDALYSGTKVVGSYSHADTFQVPGTNYIGMYFAPYMGDPSTTLAETAQQGLTALQITLSTMRKRSGNRPLFIFEYEFVSNSPQEATNPGLGPSQVSQFIAGSEPILKKYTIGYALWAYRDYTVSPLFNASFSLGTSGWTTTGTTRIVPIGRQSYLSLAEGASAEQTFQPTYLASSSAHEITVSLSAEPVTGSSSTLKVQLGSSAARYVTVRPGAGSYEVQFPASAITGNSGGQLSVTAEGPVDLSDVQVYTFTQVGDVYDTNGNPEVAATAVQALNQRLASGATS